MGKDRHSKDKLWITSKEHQRDFGGHKNKTETKFEKLPFYCCSLSLIPFRTPVCSPKGHIFDLLKYKKNPIDGSPLKASELVKLSFSKNSKEEYHCPVTYKIFTDFSKIIAIRETGNVYSYEAYEQLNKGPKHFFDLLTEAPFDPKNAIILQDPNKLAQNISDFDFMKNQEDVGFIEEKMKEKQSKGLINLQPVHKRVLEQLKDKEEKKEESKKNIEEQKAENVNEERVMILPTKRKEIMEAKAPEDFRLSPKEYIALMETSDNLKHKVFTEGKAAPSFTSTSLDPTTKNKFRAMTQKEVRDIYYKDIRKKKSTGYVQLKTNYGNMNLEIYSYIAPKTGENFLELCEQKYFKGTTFHRLIKNFMIQGGDPEGSGLGGDSYFGGKFADEIDVRLTHKGPGMLSMANSGPNTNKSQFFITFKSCEHLDGKHTVFGKVVGGLSTLDTLNEVEVMPGDKPKNPVQILDCIVYVNPYRDSIQDLRFAEWKKKADAIRELNIDKNARWTKHTSTLTGEKESQTQIVGKYLKKNSLLDKKEIKDNYIYSKSKKVDARKQFTFSNW